MTPPLSGLSIHAVKPFRDDRGHFIERFKVTDPEKWGIRATFVQDNFSHSMPGVLRGLHYQWDRPQGKLVTCTRGKIWDVVVDIRHRSPTYGQWWGLEIDATQPQWFWIPAGFAHSFVVLGQEPADVWYKVDAFYNPQCENGIRWDDPQLAIPWPVKNPVLSAKDKALSLFSDYSKDPKF